MRNPACLFGDYFKSKRLEQHVSQWQIVHKTGGYLSNIQRVEKGITHPGIGPAFKLLHAIEVLPGDFLVNIVADNQADFPVSISPIQDVLISYEKPILSPSQKFLFGPMLAQARKAGIVSQTAMAKAANYHLRNINSVENGTQEPGIMTALALVLTTGVDVRDFFNQLYFWWIEETHISEKL